MPQYRKRPIVVEAEQWWKNGDHPEDACPWVVLEVGEGFWGEGKIVRYFRNPDTGDDDLCAECGQRAIIHGWVDTLESGHRVCPGDWIIRGIKGEYYPCKPDIFEATYELVEEQDAKP